MQLGALTSLAEKINGDADRVRDSGHRDDFYRETERAWNVDDRINREKNRGQRNERAANRRNPQPDWSTRPDRGRAKDRDREHHKVNDPVENVGGVVHQLKRFLNSGADLAGNGNDQRSRADEDDRVDRRFVSRM